MATEEYTIFEKMRLRRQYKSEINNLKIEIDEYSSLNSGIKSLIENLRYCANHVSSCYENIMVGIESEDLFVKFEKINEYSANIKNHINLLENKVQEINSKVTKCESDIVWYKGQLAKL